MYECNQQETDQVTKLRTIVSIGVFISKVALFSLVINKDFKHRLKFSIDGSSWLIPVKISFISFRTSKNSFSKNQDQ